MAKHNSLEHSSKKIFPKMFSRKTIGSFSVLVNSVDPTKESISITIVDGNEAKLGNSIISLDTWQTLNEKMVHSELLPQIKRNNLLDKKIKSSNKQPHKHSDALHRTPRVQRMQEKVSSPDKKPLFVQQSIVEIAKKQYRLIKYEYDKKKYTLEDQTTKEIIIVTEKDILERGWRYIRKYIPAQKEETPKVSKDKQATKDVQEQTHTTENKKTTFLKQDIQLDIVRLTTALVHDDRKIKQLEEQIAVLILEQKKVEGRKIFEEVVAQKKDVLKTGIEGNEFYYDKKDDRGNTIRHYYQFDGSYNGNKTITSREKKKTEPVLSPIDASRIRDTIRFHLDNPKEATTTTSEDLMEQYPAYVKKILSTEKLIEGLPDEVVFAVRQLFDKGNTITSIEDTDSEYAIYYTDEKKQTVIDFIAKHT